VSFFSLSPDTLFQRHGSKFDFQNSQIDQLASFILDSANQIPIVLSISPLLSLKRYDKEKQAMVGALKRAGFAVDGSWNLNEPNPYQEDVKLYVSKLLGLNEENQGDFYIHRKKGDQYFLKISSSGKAIVEYLPSERNTNAISGKFSLKSSKLLRGIILTYISESNCSDELRDVLPRALLDSYLK
jgi:hypothetical protein